MKDDDTGLAGVEGHSNSGVWICPGCQKEIAEGEHFMRIEIEIDTRMPHGYKPPVEVPNNRLRATVHNPDCGLAWQANHELLTNVFG